MSTAGEERTASDREPRAAPRRPRWRLALGLLVGAPLAAVVVLVALFVLGHLLGNRSVPGFARLADAPDPSLHGTVAYVDRTTGCVRLIAASGARSKDLLCDVRPVGDPEHNRKEQGPQLAWRPDGRLEVTMFWMTGKPGWVPSRQMLVDPRTGAVVAVPAAELPALPSSTARVAVNPSGQRVSFTSNPGDGKVRITLTEADGTARTLLSAQGPSEYTYGLASAFWSPTWDWIAADDGRVLVVTVGAQPVTRVLVPDVEDQPEMPSYAVTAVDLLA